MAVNVAPTLISDLTVHTALAYDNAAKLSQVNSCTNQVVDASNVLLDSIKDKVKNPREARIVLKKVNNYLKTIEHAKS